MAPNILSKTIPRIIPALEQKPLKVHQPGAHTFYQPLAGFKAFFVSNPHLRSLSVNGIQ
jgi:hypothetical protein